MSPKQLLKNLLPGLLPLLVFVIADEIWGTLRAMYIAIGFAVIELSYIYIKEKRIDKFVILDTLLLIGLGGISIILENDIFFLLKPALIESILLIVVGISAFSPKNLIMAMSQRYLKNITITDEQQKQMQQSMRALFWIVLFHIGLVIYSAYYMSKEAWVFISSVLLYVLFAAYIGFEFLKKKKQLKKQLTDEEWFPLVDEEGNVIGKAPRSYCHNKTFVLHPVVHLHILNNKGQLYLQKRPMHKDVQPGKWDTAVGGHIGLNESLEDALKREVKEEVGITDFEPRFIHKYVFQSQVEKELVFTFITNYNGTITPDPYEVEEGRFWDISEIKKKLGQQMFTPNFEDEFKKLIHVFSK